MVRLVHCGVCGVSLILLQLDCCLCVEGSLDLMPCLALLTASHTSQEEIEPQCVCVCALIGCIGCS